jgi:ATP-dependent Lon protease
MNAAFVEFGKHSKEVVSKLSSEYDYILYYNDLQSKDVSDEVSVAEVVGLCSALAGVPVIPSMPIVGRVVMSGSMMPLTTSLHDIIVTAVNAGAKKIMLPEECKDKFDNLSNEVKKDIVAVYYSTPIDAAKKALRIGE